MTRRLQSPRYIPLPTTSTRPEGWLKNQLHIQADGLSGHLDDFWPDIKDSAWFGGEADGWERAPYWLDGVIPLVFLIDVPELRDRVVGYMDYIINNQHEDGWLGPKPEEPGKHDIWALFLGLKMLVVYHDATADESVEQAVAKGLQCINGHIDHCPLFNWSHSRWFEALIAIYWLYERKPESSLLDLAVKLRAQGFCWATFFKDWPMTEPTPKKGWNYMSHVVNNAMAIKAHGLCWRFSGDDAEVTATKDIMGKLDRYHGQATGVFTGDECLAGRSPIQGTELCAVAEHMYSLEILLSLLGEPYWGDRLERIAFNALPATFSPDMWTHQYDQQANQVECSKPDNPPWTTNCREAGLFGLEPHFGCCTANLSQAWPKFAAHLWMQPAEGGIAAIAYAPSTATFEAGEAKASVTLETDYPFKDSLKFTVTVDRPAEFPFHLRIPAWADGATLSIRGEELENPVPATFHNISRTWEGETVIELRLPMKPRRSRRFNNAVSIERGPLVYALKVGDEWKVVHEDRAHHEHPHGDYELYATTPWNYALALTDQAPGEEITFSESDVGDCPFSPDGAPVKATVKGKLVEDWKMENGAAQPTPVSPVKSNAQFETLELIPYGCTNLRITEFPVLEQDDNE